MSDAQLPAPHSPEIEKDNVPYRQAFEARQAYTKFVDPCAGASKASLKCLDMNDYNKSACAAYFEAYKECKKAWMEERKRDMRAGKNVSV